MSRLIDADAPEIQKCEGVAREIVLALIAKQPTVDAVKVVRCRECICFEEHESGFTCCGSEYFGLVGDVGPDEFCSRGVRKEVQTDAQKEREG